MRLIERLVRGVWTPSNHELLQPSLYVESFYISSSVMFTSKKDVWGKDFKMKKDLDFMSEYCLPCV